MSSKGYYQSYLHVAVGVEAYFKRWVLKVLTMTPFPSLPAGQRSIIWRHLQPVERFSRFLQSNARAILPSLQAAPWRSAAWSPAAPS